jgi:thiol-disulfide isomerase/thioredoxin
MSRRLQIVFAATLFCAAFAARSGDFDLILAPGVVPEAALGVTREGEPVEPKQFAGKVLIVTFWASWCGPCLQELPKLEGIQRAAGKDNIQVVAVNIEDRDQFRRLHSQLSSSFKVLLTHDYNKASREAYGVKGIPHMFIIGRDGRIQKIHIGYGERSIDSIIAEINAALAKS